MIFFRTNAGEHVGFGHLVRCRALADALRCLGHASVMFGPPQDCMGRGDDQRFEQWIPVDPSLSDVEINRRLLELIDCRRDVVVLDDYRVTEASQLALRENQVKWLQFEYRFQEPIWANIILCATPGVAPNDFEKVRNGEAEFLLGPTFAILRDEFSGTPKRNESSANGRILVTFGGGDDCGAILAVLPILMKALSRNSKISVLSGRHNPRNQLVSNWIANYGNGRIELLVDPPSVSTLFATCDFSIMAGGTSTFEAAACGMPFLLISIADNQIRQSKGWANLGVAVYIGALAQLNPDELLSAVVRLEEDSRMRNKMAQIGRETVDGNGAVRVARKIAELTLLSET